MSPPSSESTGGEFFQPPTLLASLLPVGQQVLAGGWVVQKTNQSERTKTVTKQTESIIKYMLENKITYNTDIETPKYTSVFDRNGKEIANIKADDLIEGLVETIQDLQTQLDDSNSVLQRLYELEQDIEAEKSLRFDEIYD